MMRRLLWMVRRTFGYLAQQRNSDFNDRIFLLSNFSKIILTSFNEYIQSNNDQGNRTSICCFIVIGIMISVYHFYDNHYAKVCKINFFFWRNLVDLSIQMFSKHCWMKFEHTISYQDIQKRTFFDSISSACEQKAHTD